VTHVLRTVAVGESRVDEAIADLETSSNPTVGLSAHPGQTDVRIVAKAATAAEAEALAADFEAKIRQRLGAAIYGVGDASFEGVIADLLRERGATLAVAETLTQGDISLHLSAYPDVFCGGVVAGDGPALARPLGVEDANLTGESGAVALARAVRRAWNASYGLAVVGDEADRAWVAVASEGGVDSRRLRFQGRDMRARTWTTTVALEFVRRLLLGLAEGWAD
jgi:nicotinamide-nucleotide amidase